MFDDVMTPPPEGGAPLGATPVVDASTVLEWSEALASAQLDADDAARVDWLRALEQLKCAAEGVQAAVTADFDQSQRARAAEQGVPRERQGRGIPEQVALARRESPHRGRRHLALARVLREELPCTNAALRAGLITEYRASLIAAETSCLSLEDRLIIDAALAGDPGRVETMGDRETAAAARKLASELDAETICARRRKAEADRTVTIRPAPDTMTWVSALLPVKDGVAVHTALRKAADTARANGDPRTRGQVMADALMARVAGSVEADSADLPAADGATPAVPVSLGLVMTDRTLLAGGQEAGWLDGYGPIPADLARELVHQTLTSGDKLWLNRLYTHPTTGELVAADSRQRLFRGSLARLIRLRDRTCRAPWCDAPIRDGDHVKEARTHGPTSQENGQGLCRACNLAKQAPGWNARAVRDGPHHEVETTTPTGHRYRSRAPALTRPPYRRTRPGVWSLSA